MKRQTFLVALLLMSTNTITFAQASEDFMRSTGKIYVVVAVIIAIFIGIVAFLMYLDRKLTKLENQIKEDNV
ncbi:MAG: CcmD family protein [Bacteroidota bacterium]